MTRLWFRLLITGTVLALAACAEPNRSWETLMQSLPPGSTVVVTRHSSAQLEGRLLGITADSITVKWHGQPQVVPREEVYRVRIANIRRRHTLTVMALAGLGGAVIAAVQADTYRGAAALLGGGICAGAGAAVGGALPIGEPLYQVAGPPQRALRQPTRD